VEIWRFFAFLVVFSNVQLKQENFEKRKHNTHLSRKSPLEISRKKSRPDYFAKMNFF